MHKKKNYRFNVQKQKKNSRYIYSNCSSTFEIHEALTLLFPAHLYSDRSISWIGTIFPQRNRKGAGPVVWAAVRKGSQTSGHIKTYQEVI